MAEIVIPMHANFRGEVLRGERTSAWRPGHRGYQEGPATIRFLADDQFSDENAPPVDVILTKVEHAEATGKYAIFADFLGLGEDITLLEWALA
jgi:hypothetical protein